MTMSATIREPARNHDAAAARAPKPAVLFLAHRLPYPPDKGDRIRTFHLLKLLSERAEVHLACLADEPPASDTIAVLERHCERLEVVRLSPWGRWPRALGSLAKGRTVSEGAFASPALRDLLRGWSRETSFHAALASASSLVPYLRLPELQQTPKVVDLVDVDSQKWLDYASASRGPRAWLYQVEGHRLRRLEAEIPDWAQAVTLVSPAEADLYRRFRDSASVHAIGNGVDLEAFQPRPASTEAERGLVFVGALDYRPNVDAACWFCQEVWPALRDRVPGVSLALVGRQPTLAVQRLAGRDGIELVGQVPDVRPYVASAAVAIAPLRIARGVQNKVLEAMAMGKAVVASPQALEGLQASPGVHALAASNPAEWVEALASLLSNAESRQSLGTAARRYVEEQHDWTRCLEPFTALLGLDAPGRPNKDPEGTSHGCH